jgi:tRNA (adenine22-N1)-methyltransferase
MPHAPPLSARLRALFDAVPQGARVADVGCNHALLGAALIRSGRASRVIGLENKAAPLALAARQAAAVGPGLEVRQSDGLSAVAPGEVDVIVLAGMGGGLIAALLEAAPAVVARSRRVLLQPERNLPELRQRLVRMGLAFEEEWIIEEGESRHWAMALRPAEGDQPPLSEADAFFGPLLRARRSAAFLMWLEREEARRTAALAQLCAARPDHPEREAAEALLERIRAERRASNSSPDSAA